MSDNKEIPKNEQDPELEDLLDSALEDMTAKPTSQQVAKPSEQAEMPSNMWSEEFIKEAAAQFENNMAAILGSFSGVPEDQISQEQIADTFTKMAEAAAQVLKPAEETEAAPVPADDPEIKEKIDEVSAAISQTLKNLSTNSETLQNPMSEQDIANMFGNLNFGEAGQDSNMFVPFMQGMMQCMLSKEVLYPSLKDLVDKYPDWLKENKGKIDQNEYDRFEKQLTLMQQVCSQLEPEQESDSEEVKRNRFEKVLELMQKDSNMFVPFMQGMMQCMLSKEVLYPSLKEYPDWLKENKGKIDQNEYDRLSKQEETTV